MILLHVNRLCCGTCGTYKIDMHWIHVYLDRVNWMFRGKIFWLL